jgi:hypothetical protein
MDGERRGKGSIQLRPSLTAQVTNELGQSLLREADEPVAVDTALGSQALVGPDRHLGRESGTYGVHWRADDGRVFRIDQDLAADHQKDPEFLLIAAV